MISAIYNLALPRGANRVIRGARIEHVCGDPTLSPEKDYAFGMRIVTAGLEALTMAGPGPPRFERRGRGGGGPPRWRRARRRRPPMRLELGTFPVMEIAFGSQTRYDGGRLTVDRDAVLTAVREDPRIASAQL